MFGNEATRLVLRQERSDDMRMRKLAPKTQSAYLRAVQRLAGFLGRSPSSATAEDLRRFQLSLVDAGSSPIVLNATLTGLKFFLEVTLDRAALAQKLRPVRVPRTLPVVLSLDEVARLIAGASNLKHQTALSVTYGAGLRASKVVSLKVVDIDSQRMALRVEHLALLDDATVAQPRPSTMERTGPAPAGPNPVFNSTTPLNAHTPAAGPDIPDAPSAVWTGHFVTWMALKP